MLLLLGARSPPDLAALPCQVGEERALLRLEAIADRAPPGWRSLIVDPEAGDDASPAWAHVAAGEGADLFRALPLGEVQTGDATPVERIALCLVFSNPVEGREAEFNDWYSQRHLPDVLRVPGYLSARRFSLESGDGGPPPGWRYLAIYEVDFARYDAALTEVAARSGTDLMPISDAAARPLSAHFLMPWGQRSLTNALASS